MFLRPLLLLSEEYSTEVSGPNVRDHPFLSSLCRTWVVAFVSFLGRSLVLSFFLSMEMRMVLRVGENCR